MKESWITLTPEQRAEINHMVSLPGWRVVSWQELPSVFPDSFKEKIDSALLISAPTSTGGTYLVMNALRVDLKGEAVDQEPFGLIVNSTGPSSSGVFLHHGDWEGRTKSPPPEFWKQVEDSGIGDYFYANPPCGLHEGTLDQLPKGHRDAFDTAVQRIRARKDSKK